MTVPRQRTPGDTSYPARTSPTRPVTKSPGFCYPVKAVKDTLNRVLPSDTTGYVRPRGLLVPIDPWLRGETRWARKIGGQGSVWRPDIIMKLEAPYNAGDTYFSVHQIPDSLIVGSILQVTPTSRVRVLSWDLNEFLVYRYVEDDPEATLPKGSSIQVWGWPVVVEDIADKSDETIVVSTPLLLAPGDKMEVPVSEDQWSYTTSYSVSRAELLEEDAEGYKYYLTLGKGLLTDLVKDTTIYMRAYPAYFSGRIPIPDFSVARLRVNGPFLLDFMSGPLVRGTKYEEFVSVREFRSDRSTLVPLRLVDHNAQILTMPIGSDQLLMWSCEEGSIDFDGTHTHMVCSDEGHFRLVEKLAPLMDPPEFYATGGIRATSTADLLNNEWFSLSDGDSSVTFEFQLNDAFVATPGRTTVDLRTVTVATQVAAAIAGAIIRSVLTIETHLINDVVYLTNRIPGDEGNVDVTEGVSSTTFAVTGMTGGGGGIRWIATIDSPEDGAKAFVSFRPNGGTYGTEFSLSTGSNVVFFDLPAEAVSASHIDFRILGSPGARFLCSALSLSGSRTSYVDAQIVVRTEAVDWAGSCLFAKPLWPGLDLLRPLALFDRTSSGAVML